VSEGGTETIRPAKARERAFDHRDLIIAGLLFLVAFLVYVRTLAPDVLFGDSGEFQVVARTGGLAHTTGYPIYLLIARLFTYLPFGSIAYNVNLLSAFMGAIAVGELFLIGRALGIRATYAIAAAVFLFINPIFWWQSVIAEVYAISTAFFLAFMLCAVVWRNRRNPRWLAVGGFLGGLCFGLHFTTLLALPAIILYLVFVKAQKREWLTAASGAGAGLIIAFVAYVTMAASPAHANFVNCIRPSASEYGMKPEDFNHPLTAVEYLVTARQFREDIATFSVDQSIKNSGSYGAEAVQDFGWAGLAFAVLGVVYLFARKGRRAQGFLLALSYLILFIWVLKYRAYDIEVFYLLSFSLICLFIGIGLNSLQEIISRRNSAYARNGGIAGLALVAVFILPVLGGAASSAMGGTLTFLSQDEADYPYRLNRPHDAHEAAKDIVSSLGPNALFLGTWTMQYPIYYVANFEANRPDIEADEWDPHGGHLADSMLDYIDESYKTRPVYVFAPLPKLAVKYDFVPVQGEVPLYMLHLRGT